MQVRVVGENAVLVECADHGAVAAAYALLSELSTEFEAVDVVPAARTVLIDGVPDAHALGDRLAALTAPAPADLPATETVELAVRYDGADLDEVARQWDCSTADVVRLHTSTLFRVAFCGFAPGFAYCTGLPVDRAVARRTDPRTAVPPGSVALAGEFTGVYPRSSPGGWQLIGRTLAPLWRPDLARPALLTPGTSVRFTEE